PSLRPGPGECSNRRAAGRSSTWPCCADKTLAANCTRRMAGLGDHFEPVGPPPTWPPPAGGGPYPQAQGGSQDIRVGDAWRIFPGNHLSCPRSREPTSAHEVQPPLAPTQVHFYTWCHPRRPCVLLNSSIAGSVTGACAASCPLAFGAHWCHHNTG